MSSSASVDAAGTLAAPPPIMSGRFATVLPSVPAPLTPLVGREQVVAQALDLLRTSDVRLLTLTGPGGVGKTRLAIRLAEQAAGDFPGGVVFVPLASVDNPRLLLLTIAQTLGLRESGSIPRIEQLALVLGGRPRLLVLDNFEQIIEAGPVITELMSACPALKILVTSRAVLHVSGEQELVVLPLTLPGAARSRSLDDIARTEAVALFTMRASSVNPDFRLTQENAPSIAEICNRLDGLPLAIELAAARTKVLSPSALAGRLGDRLTVLIGGPRDQPARLQTMRAAIGWSYDLLEADDRQLFRQLAVFPTGFSLDAAEHVAGSSLVLDRVASLVDSSLLQRVGTQADPRFTMLETIRAFALEQLIESGEEVETRRRHAGWCRTLFAGAVLGQGDAPSQAALDRLEQEHDSIRAALGWLLDSGEIEQAAEMIVEAWWFWFTHGHLAIGRFWSTRALERLGPELTPLRLRLSIAAGWFIEAMGELDLARAMQTDGLALARQLGDPFTIGIALYALADVIDEHWDVQRALVLFGEAAEVFGALGTITWLSATLNSIGAAHREGGAYDQAVVAVEESLALARTCGFTWMVAHSTSHLARIYSIRGDLERAIAFDRETIPLWHDLGDWWRLSRTITEFGIVIERTGQFEYATRLLAGSEAMREQLNVAFMTLLTPAWERSLANLHRHLSDTAFAENWEAGRSLSLDELLALAMTSPEPPARVAQHDTTATAGLSSREMDVLRLLVAGHSDRQIAEALFISHRTAQGHVGSIFNKLGVNSRTAAATTAIRLGLISDGGDPSA